MIILLRREYWEHRGAIFILPLVVTGALMLIMALVFMGASSITQIAPAQSQSIHIEGNSNSAMTWTRHWFAYLVTQPREVQVLQFNRVFFCFAVIFYVILWFVSQFYLLGCLFADRKDRSVLFWKSMPVSDLVTVIAKLITALIVIPSIYLGFLMVLQITILMGLFALAIPHEASIWTSANLVARWSGYVGYILFSAIWCLPLYGWLLLVSAWAKSVPLAWVIGIPALVVVLEAVFTDSALVRHFIGQHILLKTEGYGFSIADVFGMIAGLQTLSAIALGIIFIALASVIRSRSNEI